MKNKFSAALGLSALPFLCILLLTGAPRGRFRQIHFAHKLSHEEGTSL
jgi:hypothetical protein